SPRGPGCSVECGRPGRRRTPHLFPAPVRGPGRMTGPLVPAEPLTYGTELNAVYAIARVVAETFDTETGLDTIFPLSRPIFIFDVISLFREDEETGLLEPSYALALGRGRDREADLAWGEQAA